MSVEQANVVDLIGIDGAFVILTISDHLDWVDELAHLHALQEKINVYLRFVESGELLTAYPGGAGKTPVIDVVTRVAPSAGGTAFFDQIRPILTAAGFELRVRVLGQ